MAYGSRRRFRRRVRRVRRRPSSARRRYPTFRKTYRKFRGTVTGIGPKKSMKVRKDFSWTVAGAAPGSTYNILLVGGAQHANLQGWGQFTGNTASPVTLSQLDTTGATGLSQWFNFYGRYVVHASKIKVEVFAPSVNNDLTLGWAVTLVPTIGYNLGVGANPTVAFDAQNIDPGELPYARKILLPCDGQTNNVVTRKLSSYVSVKKMLNIKDIQDVASIPGQTASGDEDPFVPAITNATTIGAQLQPLTAALQINGIYWNLVFQEIGRKQEPAPAQPFHGSLAVRIIQTSYIQFSDRKPLTT